MSPQLFGLLFGVVDVSNSVKDLFWLSIVSIWNTSTNACESNSLIMFSVFKNRGDKSILDQMLASIRTPMIVKCEIDLYIGLILYTAVEIEFSIFFYTYHIVLFALPNSCEQILLHFAWLFIQDQGYTISDYFRIL